MTPEERALQLGLFADLALAAPSPGESPEEEAPPPAKLVPYKPKPPEALDLFELERRAHRRGQDLIGPPPEPCGRPSEAWQRQRLERELQADPPRCRACLQAEPLVIAHGHVKLCGACCGQLEGLALIAGPVRQPAPRGAGLALAGLLGDGARCCSFCQVRRPTRGLEAQLVGRDALGEADVPVIACPACLRSLRRCLGLSPPRA